MRYESYDEWTVESKASYDLTEQMREILNRPGWGPNLTVGLTAEDDSYCVFYPITIPKDAVVTEASVMLGGGPARVRVKVRRDR
jgi:hypothetical protein